jgi:hypothetical protein
MRYDFKCTNQKCPVDTTEFDLRLEERDEEQPCAQCGQPMTRVIGCVIPKHGSWSTWRMDQGKK